MTTSTDADGKVDERLNAALKILSDKSTLEMFDCAMNAYSMASELIQESTQVDGIAIGNLYDEFMKTFKEFKKTQRILHDISEAKRDFT